MAKVITFSRTFPSYHPKAGQPTYFVEKFWKSLDMPINQNIGLVGLKYENVHLNGKHHTIRAGERWKKGQYFSPRVWSGKPYHSKQILIAPDTLITDVYDFEIKPAYKLLPLDYDTDVIINHNFFHTDSDIMQIVAKNDGLTLAELLQWFKYPKPFKGQIICWNQNAKY
jgi:hypothetical protein